MTIKMLFDTDIGSDIDDAVCLAYLLAQPECELLGITTVTGETKKRAMLASALCKVARKQIPIFPGIEKPLLIEQKQPRAQQASALERWEHDTTFPEGQIFSFLQKTIQTHPGEIILLATGPLTNIALLFAMDPTLPSLLKGLVLMCGMFTNTIAGAGPREWNALCDPHATAMVYQAAVQQHRSVGLDVTCQVTMNANQVRKEFDGPILCPVRDFAEVWFTQTDTVTFHDPLAATTIFDKQICPFTRGHVEVELTSERLQGMTYWSPERIAPEHEVAFQVDSIRFFEHYLQITQAYRPN